MNMDRTIKLKLSVSEEDKKVLKKTINVFNTVFNEVSQYGFDHKSHSKVSIHQATYKQIREKYPELPSSLVQGARDCACEALKGTKIKRLPVAKPFSSIRYNQRVITYYLKHNRVSIATINGRIKATFNVPECYRGYIDWEVRSSVLKYDVRKDCFFLHVIFRIESPKPSGDKVLGIDRGIVNVAVCSNNVFFNGKSIKNTRGRYAFVRKQLQSKGTKSAKCLLKKRSRKEKQFVTDVNHCISKTIVNLPYDIFALEDLTSIRVQSRRKGKNFNRKLNNWSFYQLAKFLEYKAEALGKSVLYVDARFSSQKCSKCGDVRKSNREGSSYHCKACGVQIHADLNASRNIAQAGISCLSRLSVNQPNVATV
ncbi:MAG TPA: transposase [Methanosarcina sp.]|nr:transposase [Methanosarcina sp.]